MALPNVATLLAKEFVPLVLDYDRQLGAREIERRYTTKEQGLPWFVFIDGGGVARANSTAPTGNVGHPYQPNEVEWFKSMLTAVKHHLTDAEIDVLITSIIDANKAGG
jgi:hypothetical protein